MSGRVVDLSTRLERPERPSENGHQPKAPRPIHGWDVNTLANNTIEDTFPPTVSCVRWLINVDPYRRRWQVEIVREGWQHSTLLQGSDPAVLVFLNEVLSASFGIPA